MDRFRQEGIALHYRYANMTKGRVGQITNVWVDEAFRRQGIATEMVRQLMEKAASETGMVCLNSSETAVNMYKAIGFEGKANYLVYYFAV